MNDFLNFINSHPVIQGLSAITGITGVGLLAVTSLLLKAWRKSNRDSKTNGDLRLEILEKDKQLLELETALANDSDRSAAGIYPKDISDLKTLLASLISLENWLNSNIDKPMSDDEITQLATFAKGAASYISRYQLLKHDYSAVMYECDTAMFEFCDFNFSTMSYNEADKTFREEVERLAILESMVRDTDSLSRDKILAARIVGVVAFIRAPDVFQKDYIPVKKLYLTIEKTVEQLEQQFGKTWYQAAPNSFLFFDKLQDLMGEERIMDEDALDYISKHSIVDATADQWASELSTCEP